MILAPARCREVAGAIVGPGTDGAVGPGIGAPQPTVDIQGLGRREADLHGGLDHLGLGLPIQSSLDPVTAEALIDLILAEPVIAELDGHVAVYLIAGEGPQTEIAVILARIKGIEQLLDLIVVIHPVKIGPASLATDIPGIVLGGGLHRPRCHQRADQDGEHRSVHG
ncbi:hypothetical protein D3C86_1402500 [compost metagenome]